MTPINIAVRGKASSIFGNDCVITSHIPGFTAQTGTLVVTNQWPGKRHATDYKLGRNWYTDKSAAAYLDGKIQGGKTVAKCRNEVLLDWAKR